jgi:two-component system sensor histidine kinase KdpD
MDGESRSSRESPKGNHFVAAVTGSGNSEYLIRWTASAARSFGTTWKALHVRTPDETSGSPDLERNLALARDLGAETLTLTDSEVASCLVRYARITGAAAIVIGKSGEENLPFLGRKSVTAEVIRKSEDLDVVILRGKNPVPVRYRRPGTRGKTGTWRGIPAAAAALAAVTAVGLLALPAIGYRSISILYLLTIIALPFACGRAVVFGCAALSALLWNFLFIPPRMTFSIGSLEDILMFLAFFCAAFVGGFLTSRLKEKETALSLRERRMAFLYGFTRTFSRVRGIEEAVRFVEDYLSAHLGVRSVLALRNEEGNRESVLLSGRGAPEDPVPGFDPMTARRCFDTNQAITDGDRRLYLPLESQESVLGILYVNCREGRSLQGENRELLSAIAGNIALALERECLSAENDRNKMAGETARLSRILINHVSHELRTPLTTIKGAVSGLLEGNAAEDPVLRSALLAETMTASNKLNEIVEDLLAMSRLEAGKLSLRPEATFVNELIGAAIDGLGEDPSSHPITLSETAKDSEIEADPVLMAQVFRNILRNFASYTPVGSTLKVDVSEESGRAIMLFDDDGPGVPDRELPLLFDTFYRGTHSTPGQGCGLGLSICRGIVEAHGGSIEAGRSPRGGLRLTIRLPRRKTP